jgi:trimethylamine--corrinoid protein Co-methyltransferase
LFIEKNARDFDNMLRGILKVLDKDQMDLLHEKILDVLEKTGLKISSRLLLEVLADTGCRVDFKEERVWFNPELVEKQIGDQNGRYKMVRSSLTDPFCREIPENDVAWPEGFRVDYGFNVVWMYDYPGGTYRVPTVKDQIDMIHLGDALEEVKVVNIPFVCGDFDERTETIESAGLLLLNTKKPGVVEVNDGKQVKYLAELAYIAAENNEDIIRTNPPVITYVYCTTSPLRIDKRSCSVLEESLKYKFPVCFAPMPILGGTTPITPAGSIVIAAAEILGGITAASLIDPELYYFGCAITGEMDMKTTNIRFATPAAILTDAALHQLFRYKYGLVFNIDPAYVEAKNPGIQASLLKIFRQMALGSTVSLPLPIGVLDNASAHSPVQAMIDLDINRAIYGFARGIEVTEETIDTELINKIGFGENDNYLESEQTLKYYRDILWDSDLLDTTYRKNDHYSNQEMDTQLLERADKKWRKILSSWRGIEISAKFKKKVNEVIEAAKKDLL